MKWNLDAFSLGTKPPLVRNRGTSIPRLNDVVTGNKCPSGVAANHSSPSAIWLISCRFDVIQRFPAASNSEPSGRPAISSAPKATGASEPFLLGALGTGFGSTSSSTKLLRFARTQTIRLERLKESIQRILLMPL